MNELNEWCNASLGAVIFNHDVVVFIVVFFETSFLKEVHILLYLYNNSTMLIAKLQKNIFIYHTC